ncbi:MAG: ABC-type transport auxiliary lipoprotein family protein, partial [Wenzhouxiangella sp.]
LVLAGCMLARPGAPVSIVAPSVEVPDTAAFEPVDWSIQVQRPIADQMRDSDRLLVRRKPSRLQVYGDAAWLDSVPEMLQSMTVKAFGDTEKFGGVGRAGGMRTRYNLAMEIRRFEAVDDDGPDLRVELVIQANLIHQRTSSAVASRTFRHGAVSSGKALDPLIETFERALNELMTELVGWVLQEGERADARRTEEPEGEQRRWRER